jgi:prepilin-type N-terminal cleavage/methylation domain-containing protein
MKVSGMSLVELLVGLAVAAMVAAIATTGLSMMGLSVVRHRAALRTDDALWLAQAAIARDMRASTHWKGCIAARGCSRQASHVGMPVLVLEGAEWFADSGLWRCDRKREHCDKYLDGISGVEFMAYVTDADGVTRRETFVEEHSNTATAVEVVLWTTDGGRYSRTTGAHERRAVEGVGNAP